jgi:orotate phosphoribosyltransferase
MIRETLRLKIDHQGIYRCLPGSHLPGKAPGAQYSWQFYLRRVMYDPVFIGNAAQLLADQLDLKGKQLGACEDAGVPIACAISLLTGTPMLSIKKTRKAYGLLNYIEGPITGDPVILIDDLAGSQKSLMNAQSILNAFKIPVASQYATLVNKTVGTHNTYLKGDLKSLFTCEDFNLSYESYYKCYGRAPEFGFTC